ARARVAAARDWRTARHRAHTETARPARCARASLALPAAALRPARRLKGRAPCCKRRAAPPAPRTSGTGLFPQPNAELAQLFLVHRARRVHQQVLRALRLRERDHIADRIDAGHQRDQPIEPEGDAAMRRGAVLEGLEQEAELGARLVLRDAERLEL